MMGFMFRALRTDRHSVHTPPARGWAASRLVLGLAILVPVIVAIPTCQAQRNSGAATITLTAVLAQSLTMSVTPSVMASPSASSLLAQATDGDTPLTISTKWVRGPASVSVGVFAPANPLLGMGGRAMVPVQAASARTDIQAGNGFFSSSEDEEATGGPEIRIHTSDLEISDGSEAGALTIRAQVL